MALQAELRSQEAHLSLGLSKGVGVQEHAGPAVCHKQIVGHIGLLQAQAHPRHIVSHGVHVHTGLEDQAIDWILGQLHHTQVRSPFDAGPPLNGQRGRTLHCKWCLEVVRLQAVQTALSRWTASITDPAAAGRARAASWEEGITMQHSQKKLQVDIFLRRAALCNTCADLACDALMAKSDLGPWRERCQWGRAHQRGVQAGSKQLRGRQLSPTMQGLWLQGGAHTQDWSHTEQCLQQVA